MGSRQTVGRKVGGWLYVHRDAVPLLKSEDQARISDAASISGEDGWNVVKLRTDTVSLLTYEPFDHSAFPALLGSVSVDLVAKTFRSIDYSTRNNPPVLHRKELLLPPDDHRIAGFAALTRAAEEHGLFRQPGMIGTRKAWLERIEAADLVLDGHSIKKRGTQP